MTQPLHWLKPNSAKERRDKEARKETKEAEMVIKKKS